MVRDRPRWPRRSCTSRPTRRWNWNGFACERSQKGSTPTANSPNETPGSMSAHGGTEAWRDLLTSILPVTYQPALRVSMAL